MYLTFECILFCNKNPEYVFCYFSSSIEIYLKENDLPKNQQLTVSFWVRYDIQNTQNEICLVYTEGGVQSAVFDKKKDKKLLLYLNENGLPKNDRLNVSFWVRYDIQNTKNKIRLV